MSSPSDVTVLEGWRGRENKGGCFTGPSPQPWGGQGLLRLGHPGKSEAGRGRLVQPLPPLTTTLGDAEDPDLVTGSHMAGQKPGLLGFLRPWRPGVTQDPGGIQSFCSWEGGWWWVRAGG